MVDIVWVATELENEARDKFVGRLEEAVALGHDVALDRLHRLVALEFVVELLEVIGAFSEDKLQRDFINSLSVIVHDTPVNDGVLAD